MEHEFEVKVLDIDVEEIKKKLESLGAKKIIEREMRRNVYSTKPGNHSRDILSKWIRLRDNGERVTLSIKEVKHDGIDGTKEMGIVVDDFEKTEKILKELSFICVNYQENKRISYKLDEVKVEIDFWPKIPPYIEIEGDSPEEVEKAVKLLGFDMSQTTSISVVKVYEKYGLNLNDFQQLKS